MNRFIKAGLPEYSIPRNLSKARPLEQEVKEGKLLFEGNTLDCVSTAPLFPHTYGLHEVMWFPTKKTNILAHGWEDLLQDEVLVEQLESEFHSRQKKNDRLRMYGHETVRSIRHPLKYSTLIERSIQSIPQPHVHFAEDIASAPLDKVSLLSPENPEFASRLAIILNHSQELFSKWLIDHDIPFGSPVLYQQEIGLTKSVKTERTVFEFESFFEALNGIDGLKRQLEPIWFEFVDSVESLKISQPHLVDLLKTSSSPNFALLIPSIKDAKQYHLDGQKTYVYAGTLSSPVELLMKGSGWLNRI